MAHWMSCRYSYRSSPPDYHACRRQHSHLSVVQPRARILGAGLAQRPRTDRASSDGKPWRFHCLSTRAPFETSSAQSVVSRLVHTRYESNYKTVAWSALPPIRLFPSPKEPRPIVESRDARYGADAVACPLAAADCLRCASACAPAVVSAFCRSGSATAPQGRRRCSSLLFLAYSLLVRHHALRLDTYRSTARRLDFFC